MATKIISYDMYQKTWKTENAQSSDIKCLELDKDTQEYDSLIKITQVMMKVL